MSDSDQCSVSDNDSEFNYIPGNYSVIESEIMEASDGENGADDRDEKAPNVEPYSCSYYGIFVAQFMCLIDA